MKRFNYKAKNKEGKTVAGVVEAPDEKSAVKLIRDRGLLVIKLAKTNEFLVGGLAKFEKKVKPADVSLFTRQFSTMVNAGLPVTESLSILRTQSKPTLQPIVSQILSDVEGGQSLSAALGKHPDIFNTTYIALIKAGETGGVLDNVLNRIADNLEKQEEFKGKVKGALIYPAIVVVGMIIVTFIMMIFVVPKLTSLYTEFDATLPLPTKILVAVSHIFVTFWPFVIVALLVGVWGFRAYRKTPAGRKKVDALVFKIPVYGQLQKEIILTEFTRTLGLMVGSGVSILEGMAVTAAVVSNTLISDALKDAADKIEKGFPVAFSFAKHPDAFPFILSQMIAVGEETGKMEDVLNKVSHIFEIESDQKVKGLTAAIEPIVMIVLGLGVAFLMIAIIMPIYNLTSSFK
ncbi:MAG: type II secretion system F family protein [Patescibacteria group bacterium]